MSKFVYAFTLCASLFSAGCVTRDVNPPRPKPGTGYVDFYVDDTSGLCWQIWQLKKADGKGKTLFEEFKPRTNEVIRLAFAPGDYRLGINFLNRAITEPGVAKVVVEDGNVTGVRVDLVETGTTITEKREIGVGGTFYGRTGRSTRLRSSEGATFRVEVETQAPMPYQPKQ